MTKPPADKLTESLLTPQELAARLKVSVRTVVRLQKGGVVPARAVLGRIRFHWPEVVASLPLAPATASGRASVPGVVALDVPTRLRLKATHFYRNSSTPGGAA